MAYPPLLTAIARALPAKFQGAPHIIQFINQLLLPATIDAAVYLDLQRVLNVFGATSTWTFAAMDGAAARGRLKLVKCLNETRSEGCSAAAFNQAAANNHLRVLHWLCKRHHFKCNATEAAVCAAVAGHLNVIKHLRAQSFSMDYRIVLKAAAIKEQIQVVEYLLTIPDLETHLALTAASKNGLTQLMRFFTRRYPKIQHRQPVQDSCPRVCCCCGDTSIPLPSCSRVAMAKVVIGVYSSH